MSSTEPQRHVLIWVTAEFLESEGMLHILQESGALAGHEEDWEKIVQAAENTGGFALGGILVDVHHGAGIWFAPLNDAGLEIMIPWQFVRSVVTAQEQQSARMFGLAAESLKRSALLRMPTGNKPAGK
jgi:hypothetical protein